MIPRDHPRSRGEHHTFDSRRSRAGGPSPLARGTHTWAAAAKSGYRTIPARAGNTGSRALANPREGDHPRSRGEHGPRSRTSRPRTGPSPLARGTPKAAQSEVGDYRTIPARAGNTNHHGTHPPAHPDHPRSRGEHEGRIGGRAHDQGPSPLARGTLLDLAVRQQARGTIPARAGNTNAGVRTAFQPGDHPRSRGEHGRYACGRSNRVGPSPLARGTLHLSRASARRRRTIPARAGNTPSESRQRPASPDHPRSRGEHEGSAGGIKVQPGPSPLARGTRRQARGFFLRGGTIPARAGNTSRSTSCGPACRDHPRSRGEHPRGAGA